MTIVRVSSQRPYDVIQVADTGSFMMAVPSSCHPSALITWIQKKEWCHASSLLLLSSE
ncbi:hypothetical protein [Wolbachia endosymbiont (group A) of Gymnosoma rotundatum]|uniref:hypothetical protein n=1 Tax=Wolbachia endosymbiont (group A) of Gymnosoma rotundatum TaxID=2954016 RepID=UPI0022278570|nr:hypothetical protein [Wolbachia endosymbiont (group A) of Gymnosoma rotundatum]